MNIIEKNQELVTCSVVLETSASELTQGLGGKKIESCCSKHYEFY